MTGTDTRAGARLGKAYLKQVNTLNRPAMEHPGPNRPDLPWACKGHADPEMFCEPKTLTDLQEAQSICGGCEMRALCLDLGLKRREWGVWGGVLLEHGMRRVTIPRRPGRPSKAGALAASAPLPDASAPMPAASAASLDALAGPIHDGTDLSQVFEKTKLAS